MPKRSYVPCCERVFPLQLAGGFAHFYSSRLHWLRYLLERLGGRATLRTWDYVDQDYDDEWLAQILSVDWATTEAAQEEPEQEITRTLEELFPSPVQGISREEARQMVDRAPPFYQIRRHLPTLHAERLIGTYEGLHLWFDGLALLVEALMDLHGKQGELIAYDALLADVARRQPPKVSASEFLSRRLARFSTPPESADMFTAGLEVELVHGSEREVIHRVKECEWARYYRDHHPRVGYMLACSLDDATYRAFNPALRLQRTTTLMEGGDFCDFRVYAVGPDSPESTDQA